ncbi:MAG TPA: nucleoside-diphosphate kinase [Planctomycetota bacterium]|nr:nucleoside-diphosphate kinase [Planctomycetota bacterium]
MSALHERTLVIIKPDGVARGLVGEIVTRFEKKGLSLAGLKLINVDKATAEKHYAEHASKPFFPSLLGFITSGPVVVMCLEGNSAISVVRGLIGPTSGVKAPGGTIRGDLALSGQNNLIHASDSPEAASRELELWFKAGELVPAGKGTGSAARSWVYSAEERK